MLRAYIIERHSILPIALCLLMLMIFPAFSIHTSDISVALDGSSVYGSNWTVPGSDDDYAFSIETNESVNVTSIRLPSGFILDNDTIEISENTWNCSNNSDTVTCQASSDDASSSFDISFNATSPSIQTESVYGWDIDTIGLNGSVTQEVISTGVDGKSPQIDTATSSSGLSLNATDNDSIALMANVSDINLEDVTINLSALGLSSAQQMFASSGLYRYNLSSSLSFESGTYDLPINATDHLGNYNDSFSIGLTIYDVTRPSVELTSDQQDVNASGDDVIVFYADVSDTELNDVTIDLSGLDGSSTQQMYNDGQSGGDLNGSDSIWTYNMTLPETFLSGDYSVYVNATDDSGNFNDTASISVTVVDVTAPYVKDISSTLSDVPANGTNITLTVNVTDIEGLESTEGLEDIFMDLGVLGYSSNQRMYDDGSVIVDDSNDSQGGDDVYSWMISIGDDIFSGTYRLNITATDTNGNINDTEYIKIDVKDVTVPDVDSVSLTDTRVNATGSDTTSIQAEVSDLELSYVSVNMSEIGGNSTQLLYDDGTNGDISASDGIYTYLFTVPNSVANGTYTLTVNATDNSSNYNSSVSVDIDVIDTDAPQITILGPQQHANHSDRTSLINISTDEISNVSYSMDSEPYISIYNESLSGSADYPETLWTRGLHNLTINATDRYGHSSNMSVEFYTYPDLVVTDVFMTNTSQVYTGDNASLNATISTEGFDIENATVSFYFDGTLLSSENHTGIFLKGSYVNVTSAIPWNVTSGTHTIEARVAATDDIETTYSNNDLASSVSVDDFLINDTELDFGDLRAGESSKLFINLSNMGRCNQSSVHENISLYRTDTLSYNYTHPESRSFHFAIPQGLTSEDLEVDLDYNDSIADASYSIIDFNSPGYSELEVDVSSMESSVLEMGINLTIDLDESQWIVSDFSEPETLKNKGSSVFSYNLTIPDDIASGDYSGTLSYGNSNNTANADIVFSLTSPQLSIHSNSTDRPVLKSGSDIKFHASNGTGMKHYYITFVNDGADTLHSLKINFSSLNLTTGTQDINFSIMNTTSSTTVLGTSADIGDIPAGDNRSIYLEFNVTGHTEDTYMTSMNVTSLDGEPISNYTQDIYLVLDSLVDVSISHPSLKYIYPGDKISFIVDVTYGDKTPFTGLSSDDMTYLRIKDSTSKDITSSLDSLDEISSGTYMLNITLPDEMVGGNLTFELGLDAANLTGTAQQDIQIRSPYLKEPEWKSGKVPGDLDLDSYTGYDYYSITIDNDGLADSGEVKATLSTCSSSYISVESSKEETISSIPAGGTGTFDWKVDPKKNKSDCKIEVEVEGEYFWFDSNETSKSKRIDLSKSSTTTDEEEDDDESDSDSESMASSFGGLCLDDDMCDSDERCIDNECEHIECDDGYYSDHRCVEYDYDIVFKDSPSNLSVLEGGSISFNTSFKNEGDTDIEGFLIEMTGLIEGTSYSVLTELDHKIQDSETQSVEIMIDVSDNTSVGQHDVVLWFRSEEIDKSWPMDLIILPDNESIRMVDEWMPVLEKDIEDLKKRCDSIKDGLDEQKAKDLESSLGLLDNLYEEVRTARLEGDFLSVYDKRNQIEDVMAQIESIDPNISSDVKRSSTAGSWYIPWVILSLLILLAVYLYNSSAFMRRYPHIREAIKAKGEQLYLMAFFTGSKGRRNKTVRDVYGKRHDIDSYHHKPSYIVSLKRAYRRLKHVIAIKADDLRYRQTKLDSSSFSRPSRPIGYSGYKDKGKLKSDHARRRPSLHKKDDVKSPVDEVGKMLKRFEKSKTRCSLCGKNFRTKYELELHKRYSHRA